MGMIKMYICFVCSLQSEWQGEASVTRGGSCSVCINVSSPASMAGDGNPSFDDIITHIGLLSVAKSIEWGKNFVKLLLVVNLVEQISL